MRTFRVAAWVLGLAAIALLAGCATGPRITTEADPEANFASYRTFGFYSPLAIEKEGYSSAASERMKAAARAQMEARGYVFTTERPDLWLNINAYTQQRTDVTSMPSVDYAYYYSYRARGYYVVPYWRDRTDVYRYTEGTLNVDLVDVERNRLVWEGIAVGRVSREKDPAKRDARINDTMAEIFAQYPYRAGSVPAPQ
ncbi:DUF4136 domain-containing protein [Luteimonas sp. M1R5S18]|jgi:hypothetical protein|uniref:DUF4136 domain-containing protein n=1 Tax=Luteimonas rhizosphaericola TaxID=3042024 RepID=A0ABT6JKN5_9GAMM|nr:DUF4136 domain-containing protein [Luteimonas rhizosphaericola]MDH5831242.1 DUF4136 domain-containing protein [Luteimonas rhizosphaericola]